MPAKVQPWKSDSPSERLPRILRPATLTRFPELICGLSTRIGGISPAPYGMNTSFHVNDSPDNVTENRRLFLGALGVAPDRLAIPQQRHTAVIRKAHVPGTYPECDALLTNVPGIYLSVSVADCAPAFLFDPVKRVIGCVHAGWRGTAQSIVRHAVEEMQKEYGTNVKDVIAFIGPSAGPCCYEIGEEVTKEFDPQFVQRRDGKTYLDIPRANAAQLEEAGIPQSSIGIQGDCTICNSDTYHSFRRDGGQSGRMMGIIGMKE